MVWMTFEPFLATFDRFWASLERKKTGQNFPKYGQNGSKMGQKWVILGSLRDHFFSSFWYHFRAFLGRFWTFFALFFGPFLRSFCDFLVMFWEVDCNIEQNDAKEGKKICPIPAKSHQKYANCANISLFRLSNTCFA